MENILGTDLKIEDLSSWLYEIVTSYGLRLIGAIAVLIIGLWIVKKITRALYKVMEKRAVDPSLRTFFRSFLSISLKILVVISVLGMVGVEMTSFIAILGAAGLAVGLSLSGTLQNFAGGVLILILKPFKVGDVIEAQGYTGSVTEIQIFHTVITGFDNIVNIVPNGSLATGALTNYSVNDTRQAQWVFGIAYGDDFKKAQKVLRGILDADERVLKDPEPFIFLSQLNDNSVDITIRAWTKSEDFWPVFFGMSEKVYEAFIKEGLNIPFPQMDVHIHEKEK
ncbi:MAG: mechanosensitive ion channel family protein [Bacteroidales bacterium]